METRERILEIAQQLIAEHGIDALSFDAIAARLGKTKQAVLYWYPTKNDLLTALFVPWLRAEADAAVAALDRAGDRSDAIVAFVTAISEFHAADFDRFRMMYLLPQTIRQAAQTGPDRLAVDEIHPVTNRLYSAFAARLGDDSPPHRREALTIHTATLGLVMMAALADRLQDPLKHGLREMTETLAAALAGKGIAP